MLYFFSDHICSDKTSSATTTARWERGRVILLFFSIPNVFNHLEIVFMRLLYFTREYNFSSRSSDHTESSEEQSLPLNIIIPIVATAVLALMLLVLGFIYIYMKRRKGKLYGLYLTINDLSKIIATKLITKVIAVILFQGLPVYHQR